MTINWNRNKTLSQMLTSLVSRLVIVISFSYSYHEMMALKINLDLYIKDNWMLSPITFLFILKPRTSIKTSWD